VQQRQILKVRLSLTVHRKSHPTAGESWTDLAKLGRAETASTATARTTFACAWLGCTPAHAVTSNIAPCSARIMVGATSPRTACASAMVVGKGQRASARPVRVTVMATGLAHPMASAFAMPASSAWGVRTRCVLTTARTGDRVLRGSACVPRVSRASTVLVASAPTTARSTVDALTARADAFRASGGWTVLLLTAPTPAHTTDSVKTRFAAAILATQARTARSASVPTIARTMVYAPTSHAAVILVTLASTAGC